MNKFLLIVIVANLIVLDSANAAELTENTFTTFVDKIGNIRLPESFRQQWVHLGSWLVSDAKAPGHGFHDVYTQPEAVKAFRMNGVFPDGTILVKEIRKITTGKLTTGEAQWASDNAVWFLMVKDTLGRFKGNPNWGESWGWALFEAKNPKVNSSKGYVDSCLGCHNPAKQTDWVFIQGYPTLKQQIDRR
jgi:cytochrome c